MQMHVDHMRAKGKDEQNCFAVLLRGCVAPRIFAELPDCIARIPCYTAASRLPALVRRSEHKETAMPDESAPASGFQYSVANLKPVESSKVALTFPDGAQREFPKGITRTDVAKGISRSH